MSRNTSVILGNHFDEFIKSAIESGQYKSASEVIRSGLRLLETEKQKIKAINKALVIGEKSGKPSKLNNATFKARMKRKLKNV